MTFVEKQVVVVDVKIIRHTENVAITVAGSCKD